MQWLVVTCSLGLKFLSVPVIQRINSMDLKAELCSHFPMVSLLGAVFSYAFPNLAQRRMTYHRTCKEKVFPPCGCSWHASEGPDSWKTSVDKFRTGVSSRLCVSKGVDCNPTSLRTSGGTLGTGRVSHRCGNTSHAFRSCLSCYQSQSLVTYSKVSIICFGRKLVGEMTTNKE